MDAVAAPDTLQLTTVTGSRDILTATLLMLRRFEQQPDASNAAAAGRLARVGWPRLRDLLAQTFRRLGYEVEEVAPEDSSVVDLILSDGGRYTYLQCSRWELPEVRAADIRELRDAMEIVDIGAGIWVSVGRYSETAERLAARAGILLVDAVELEHLLAWAQADDSPPVRAAKAGRPAGKGAP